MYSVMVGTRRKSMEGLGVVLVHYNEQKYWHIGPGSKGLKRDAVTVTGAML